MILSKNILCSLLLTHDSQTTLIMEFLQNITHNITQACYTKATNPSEGSSHG